MCIPACMYVVYFSIFHNLLMNKVSTYSAHCRDIYTVVHPFCVSIIYHIHLIIVIVLYLDYMLSY